MSDVPTEPERVLWRCAVTTRILRIFLIALSVALISGCPPNLTQPAGTTTGATTSGGTSSGGGTTSGGTSTAASYEAQLAAQYPSCQPVADPSATVAEVLQLVNQERTSHGLAALQYSDVLEEPAMQHACEMITNDFFDHNNPVTGSSPGDRVAATTFQATTWGENIACGQATAQEVVTGWMNSPGHRANILNPDFTHLGVGVRTGGSCTIYWVQLFAG